MTVERYGELIELCCDHKGCMRTLGIYEKNQFDTMMSNAREQGWCTFKRDDKWYNACDWLHSEADTNYEDEPYWMMEYENERGRLHRTRVTDGKARPVNGTWLRTYEVPVTA